ncbi:hypothetical protein DFS34DRAFT_573955, partial [Phlyctochytrium arcticum]
IADWLSEPSNYAPIYGTLGKTKVDGAAKAKVAGLRKLADVVNRKSNNRLALNEKTMRARLTTYCSAYVKAKQTLLNTTGGGLTEADIKKGIATLAAKVELKCPNFNKVDAIFGTKPNTVAHAEWES